MNNVQDLHVMGKSVALTELRPPDAAPLHARK